MKTYARLLLFCLLALVSCAAPGLFYKKKNSEIRFGTEGGFTGEAITMCLNGEGGFSQFSSISKDTIKFKNVSMEEIKAIETMMNKDSLTKIDQNETGNMTDFLEIYSGGKLLYQYKWPSGSRPNSEYLRKLNEKLTGLERVKE